MRITRLSSISLSLVLLVICPVFGQITGIVLDRVSHEPLGRANVTLNPGDYGVATEEDGTFEVSGLESGRYDVTVSYVGYEERTIPKVQLENGDAQYFLIYLTPAVVVMEEVMVTGKRGRALTWELPVSAEVVSKKDMERYNTVTTADAVRPLAGSYVKNYGNMAAIKYLSIRGSSSEQVLILNDGVRMNSPLSGGYDLSGLPLDAIERIEFVRNGLSSLYGADAAAGVVNLISRAPDNDGRMMGSLTITHGALGSNFYRLHAGQKFNSISYFVSGGYYKSEGDYEYSTTDPVSGKEVTERRENADFYLRELFGKVAWDVSAYSKLYVSTEWSEAERGVPGSDNYPSPEARQFDTTGRYQLGYSARPGARLQLQGQLFLNQLKIHYLDPNPFWPMDTNNKGTMMGGQAQADLNYELFTLTLGGNYYIDKSEGNSIGEQQRANTALFGQSEVKLRTIFGKHNFSLTLLPSVRFDSYDDFGEVVSPKFGFLLAKNSRSRMVFRANIGLSFRAPTMNELYWPADMFSVGNPDLEPERVVNIETGALFTAAVAGELKFEVNYFKKNAKDLILWDMDPVTWISSPANVRKAEIEGQEVHLKWRPLWGSTLVQFNYTHMSAINKSEVAGLKGKKLHYRPEHSANIVLGHTIGPVAVNGVAHYMSSSFADEANTLRLEGYALADANVSLRYRLFNFTWLLRLEVDNIFDKSYYVLNQYPMPGRLWRVSLGMSL